MVNQVFDDNEDLKIVLEAQAKTINNLNKKINELNAELHTTKSKLVAIPSNSSGSIVQTTDDEETIARTQLNLLKNIALSRELTYEETKKVDIYAKLLMALMGKNKPKTIEGQDTSTEDLLRIVENNNG